MELAATQFLTLLRLPHRLDKVDHLNQTPIPSSNVAIFSTATSPLPQVHGKHQLEPSLVEGKLRRGALGVRLTFPYGTCTGLREIPVRTYWKAAQKGHLHGAF